MTKLWSQTTEEQRAILKGLGGEQGVFVRPSFVRAMGGDGNAAIIIQHMLYWSQIDMASKRDGWFYLTVQKMGADTGLSAEVQERVRKKLVQLGVLEQERRGVPARNYYRVDFMRLSQLVTESHAFQIPRTTPYNFSESRQPVTVDDGIIEDTEEHILEEIKEEKDNIIDLARPGQKHAKENVLGQKLSLFVAWIVTNYPKNGDGIGATPVQATRIAARLGDITKTNSRELAERQVKQFILGIKNFKTKVDAGTYDKKYVPRFERWSGLRIAGNDEPGYIAWSLMESSPTKPELKV